MCLIVKKGTKSEIITVDLIVYKEIKRIEGFDAVSSLYYFGFVYEPNVLYKQEIEHDSYQYYDDIAQDAYRKYRNSESRKLDSYGPGFHFATTRERLVDSDSRYIATFVVPAGSKVILDKTGLGITNQIMYTP